ncbi:MAG: AraC family transcriptional regulator [Pseudomonadota bacterium]
MFNGAKGRFGVGLGPLVQVVTEAHRTGLVPPNMTIRVIQDTPQEYFVIRIAPRRLNRIAGTAAPALARCLAQAIEDRLGGPIRVGALAAGVALSRAHFSRAFTQTFGMAPRDHILSRRTARARTPLTDTALAPSEIAMSWGFANPSHLNTAFRKEIGLTLTAYRQALQKGPDAS